MRARTRPVAREQVLKGRLDELVSTFDARTITPDPLELVLAQRSPVDREIAGLLAAAFAYGRAGIVVANVGGVLARMTPGPAAWLAARTRGGRFERRVVAKTFAGFSHRFHKTADLVALLERIALAVDRHGSLGALFRAGYDESDRDVGPALARFVGSLIAIEGSARPSASLRYLLTSPADGSACKRMNLFLRWMVRREPPDLGLWSFVDPSKLVVPLDTHVHRIATFLGLNRRKSADWKTARALTDRLARFDPDDPVRYDFAICRLGILDRCSRRRRRENCERCLLLDVCRFPVP
ncbi:MAG TPA: TIGR02757 family protein [Thermoanaerobaculia bacterium]|nr:TIGR02757 family protein [Thermoanaerobaculia bacterium]